MLVRISRFDISHAGESGRVVRSEYPLPSFQNLQEDLPRGCTLTGVLEGRRKIGQTCKCIRMICSILLRRGIYHFFQLLCDTSVLILNPRCQCHIGHRVECVQVIDSWCFLALYDDFSNLICASHPPTFKIISQSQKYHGIQGSRGMRSQFFSSGIHWSAHQGFGIRIESLPPCIPCSTIQQCSP
jgi:hypothetical protein